VVHGEAPQSLADLPDPDSVFIGGSGGMLAEITDVAVNRLKDNGRIVVNLAALERTLEVYHRLRRYGLDVELTVVNASRGKDMPDGSVRLEGLNPVFVVSGQLKGQKR
jgi:precorrin-6Y C5,15-methyltransferase (decarboxylating)